MAIGVICAGLGRTGTVSLKVALEKLGFGPCYHMQTLFAHPDQIELWRDALDRRPDWDTLLAGYRAVADEPPALFWRELLHLNPASKVVLTTRSAGSWYDSVFETVYKVTYAASQMPEDPMRDVLLFAYEMIFEGFFGGKFEDRQHAQALFREHNRQVIEGVASSQLLVFDVGQGWVPLCEFLGTPVPDEPFPKLNSRSEFKEKAGLG